MRITAVLLAALNWSGGVGSLHGHGDWPPWLWLCLAMAMIWRKHLSLIPDRYRRVQFCVRR